MVSVEAKKVSPNYILQLTKFPNYNNSFSE